MPNTRRPNRRRQEQPSAAFNRGQPSDSPDSDDYEVLNTWR